LENFSLSFNGGQELSGTPEYLLRNEAPPQFLLLMFGMTLHIDLAISLHTDLHCCTAHNDPDFWRFWTWWIFRNRTTTSAKHQVSQFPHRQKNKPYDKSLFPSLEAKAKLQQSLQLDAA